MQPKLEANRLMVPADFHGTQDSADLYGSHLEQIARAEITNVLARTERFIYV